MSIVLFNKYALPIHQSFNRTSLKNFYVNHEGKHSVKQEHSPHMSPLYSNSVVIILFEYWTYIICKIGWSFTNTVFCNAFVLLGSRSGYLHRLWKPSKSIYYGNPPHKWSRLYHSPVYQKYYFKHLFNFLVWIFFIISRKWYSQVKSLGNSDKIWNNHEFDVFGMGANQLILHLIAPAPLPSFVLTAQSVKNLLRWPNGVMFYIHLISIGLWMDYLKSQPNWSHQSVTEWRRGASLVFSIDWR